jgi:DNA primase
MARIDIQIPEPTPVYTEENQRQVSQSLQTMKDKLNTSYQRELKNEQDTFNWFLS